MKAIPVLSLIATFAVVAESVKADTFDAETVDTCACTEGPRRR